LELRAPIVQAKRLPAGTKVSYSHTYALPREGVVATVAIGYGDGYRRCFSSRARMSFAGYPAPVAGRVCMDQTLLDLTGHPRADQAKPGAFVLAAGGPRRPELGGRGCDFMTLCEEFDLPPHELIGGLGPRVEEMGAGQSALEPASRPPRPAALDAASRSFRFEEEADG
jgi:alanine racemase